jgi:hypothetical protein
MLLKTRPKFFFDIEEETKRPNRAGRKKREKRPSEAELDSSIPAPDEGLAENLPVTFEDEKPNDESSGKRVTTRTEGEVESNTEDVVASNSNMRSGRRSSGSLALTSSKRGSLSAEVSDTKHPAPARHSLMEFTIMLPVSLAMRVILHYIENNSI